jgi:hypothetical protein
MAAAAGALAAGGAASAAVIASDGFDAATHPTGSRTVVTPAVVPGNNGIPFFTRFADPGNGTATIVSDSAVGGATAEALSVTNTTASNSFPVIGVLPAMGMVTNVNDAVTLSFKFRFLNATTVADNNTAFRFGLFNSKSTPVTADNTTASNDDQGYYVTMGDATQASSTLAYNESGGTSPILGGTDRNPATASAGVTGINDNLGHTVSMTLTRTSATALGMSLVIDGGAPVTTSFSVIYPGFDEIAFSDGFVGTASGQLNFAVDDVQVTANNVVVPEPMGLGLAGVVVAGGMLGRRKRRA